MATKWLNSAEMTAWRSFIETTGDLMRAIEKDLEPFGLDRGDYQLLAMLSEAPDHKLRMCDLADSLRLTRSGLTRRMEGVLKKKLVTRVRSYAAHKPDSSRARAFTLMVARTTVCSNDNSVRY